MYGWGRGATVSHNISIVVSRGGGRSLSFDCVLWRILNIFSVPLYFISIESCELNCVVSEGVIEIKLQCYRLG